MKVKRLIAALMAVSMIAGLAACGNSSSGSSAASSGGSAASSGDSAASSAATLSDKKELTIWASGSENVEAIYESLIEEFNTNSEYAGQYEATLSFMLSGTGTASLVDGLVAAYQAGQTDTTYDLVELGGDDWSSVRSRMGVEGLTKLDKSLIPNAAGVEAEIANDGEYIQPYRGTTVVLAYNADTVTDVPETMDELLQWIKDHPGRFCYNVPGTGGAADAFVRTLVYNFLPEEAAESDDESWVEQWDEGFEVLKEIHPYMYTSGGSIVYPNKNQGALDLLAAGEVDMCPMWADMLLSQRAAGTVPTNIKMTTINPPFSGSLCGMVIPTFGSNAAGAYAFINFMLTPEAQQILVEEMAAIPLIDASTMDLTGFEDLADLDVSQFRTMSIGDLGTTFNEKWDNEIGILG